MKFKITWADGHTEVEVSEATSADAYAMERWGRPTAAEVAALYGIALEVEEPEFADTQPSEESPADTQKAKRSRKPA